MSGRSISAGTGSVYPFKSITGKGGIRFKENGPFIFRALRGDTDHNIHNRITLLMSVIIRNV